MPSNSIKSKYVGSLPVIKKNTRKSILTVAAPETTAFDIIARFKDAGGFGNVITVLQELSETLQARRLHQVSKTIQEIVHVQRLGYILDALGYSEKTGGLLREVNKRAYNYALLVPYKSKKDALKDSKWKIIVNETIEQEI